MQRSLITSWCRIAPLALLVLAACGKETSQALTPTLAYDCGADSTKSLAPVTGATCAALDFGAVTVGTTQILPIRIANIGRATLTIKSGALDDDAHNSLYAPALPSTIAAGTQVELDISFRPLYGLTLNQNYVLKTDDPQHPEIKISIKGSGDGHPKPVLSVQSLDFGNVRTQTTKYLSVRISNAGNVGMVVTGTTVRDDPAEFGATAVTDLIAPDNSADQPVTFRPVGPGQDSATLLITTDSVGPDGKATGLDVSNISIALVGESLSQLTVTPATIDFGLLTWRQTMTQHVTLENDGAAPVHLKTVGLKAGSSGSFYVSPNISLTLPVPPDAMPQDALIVTYQPSDSTNPVSLPETATLQITSDDVNHPLIEIPITGACNCAKPGPSIVVSPTHTDFNTFNPAYGDRTANYTITNQGTQDLVIFAIQPHAGSPRDFVPGPEIPNNTAIAPGKQQTFTITYHQIPRDPPDQAVTGAIDVLSNDLTNLTITITLDGACAAGPNANDGDGDGIPDACDTCLYDGPKSPSYQAGLTGDGITITNGALNGSSLNVLPSIAPGAMVTVDYDYEITAQGPQCTTHGQQETQYYVGFTNGASSSPDCVFDGIPCQSTPADMSQSLSGHRQSTLIAPMEIGTYYVQYDWEWDPMCTPDNFTARGPGQGFAAICVKKP